MGAGDTNDRARGIGPALPADPFDGAKPITPPPTAAPDVARDDDVIGLLQRAKPSAGEDGVTRPGKVLRSTWNLGTILRHDPRWAGRLLRNDFTGDDEIRVNAATPWETHEDGDTWRALTDADDLRAQRWVSEVYRLEFGTITVHEQLVAAADVAHVHPVRTYLGGLVWDGSPRLDSWLANAFSAEPSEINARIGAAWLVSMVARAQVAGCKVDTVPILVGKQGAGKSTTLKALVPVPEWYADSDIPIHSSGPDKYQVIRGRWLFEIAEFDRFSGRADAATIKAYVTSAADTYRASYGRRVTSTPRQVVFCGSTNADEILPDPTGARRYWPVPCLGRCRPEWVTAHRDQLWAEAVHRWKAGEAWHLAPDAAAEVAEVAERFRIGDPWEGPIAGHLQNRTRTTVPELLAVLEVETGRQSKADQMRCAAILGGLGWVKRGREGGKWGPPLWVPHTS